jgi:hypothetical protein
MSFNDRDGVYTVRFSNGEVRLYDRLDEELPLPIAREIAKRILDQASPYTYVYIGRINGKMRVGVAEAPRAKKAEIERQTKREFELLGWIKCRGEREAQTLEKSIRSFLTRLGHVTFQPDWFQHFDHDATLIRTVLHTFDPVHGARFFDYAAKLYMELHLINLESVGSRFEVIERINDIPHRSLQRHAYVQFGFV